MHHHHHGCPVNRPGQWGLALHKFSASLANYFFYGQPGKLPIEMEGREFIDLVNQAINRLHTFPVRPITRQISNLWDKSFDFILMPNRPNHFQVGFSAMKYSMQPFNSTRSLSPFIIFSLTFISCITADTAESDGVDAVLVRL